MSTAVDRSLMVEVSDIAAEARDMRAGERHDLLLVGNQVAEVSGYERLLG